MLPTHLAAPLLSTDEREDAEYDLVLIYSIDGDGVLDEIPRGADLVQTPSEPRAISATRCRPIANRRPDPPAFRT